MASLNTHNLVLEGCEPVLLSIVVPCYNEESTLEECVRRVLEIEDDILRLEIIIVDDHSTDNSLALARHLENIYTQVKVFHHDKNQGKGAALRTGMKSATGDFVAIQDADLEYRPIDLKALMIPLINGEADVVFGSRFLSYGAHRVLYYWHSLGNRFLTMLSNMFTDLNLTDMETCYKVFRKEVLEKIEIEENRFGFEPEIVAKVAQQKVRVYEMGISYFGRTYEEGKKIGIRDGLRALYCIVRYNGYNAPLPMQFLVYLFIGAFAASVNLAGFLIAYSITDNLLASTLFAFFTAAAVNYLVCIKLLFRSNSKWKTRSELGVYGLVVCAIAGVDYFMTQLFIASGATLAAAKLTASASQVVLNFLARRFVVFPEKKRKPWKPQESIHSMQPQLDKISEDDSQLDHHQDKAA